MRKSFRFLMISAMYENGGNTTHRFLDGHPELMVYPFESQLGTRQVADHMTSLFPVKYRWPRFELDASADENYDAIIDEELKVRSKTPQVSKFRHVRFELSDPARRDFFRSCCEEAPHTTAGIIEAFFRATFSAWKNYHNPNEGGVFVGYSPIIVVDADRIMKDCPQGHMIHVVRNPWSAYADTTRRPVPLSLATYLLGWVVCQYHALLFRDLYPERFHLLRYEDIVTDPVQVLGEVCEKMGLVRDPILQSPTWNGRELSEISPWGTILTPTPEANLATARELSPEQIEEIGFRARPFLEIFDYEDIV